ncbi:hypothetical protein LOK74_16435 [Brevibacillus humidisoli]|uniref:hypothetical protein n=1 Tax=Brevibacillus humidisoli TaxID=2895522 RepID=UPI001E301C60|nr:hypothetical protein [Brevibacillus humidisoli]UFJ39633.1 hypothetical protein LOK74_16435 [Brevibacillus humidisoli]
MAANRFPELPTPLEGFWPPYHFGGAETVMTASLQALARVERTCFSLCAPRLCPSEAKHRYATFAPNDYPHEKK